jgi:UDP-GlcNAc:undecaprenyl-phosphate GlcNAc-1-phosphate transferase
LLDNTMWLNYLLAFAAALVVSAAATPIIRKYALRWKLGDKPNGRRITPHMIPHLGGIALVLGAFAGVSLILAGDSGAGWDLILRGVVPALALIVGLGLVDDTRNLRASQKLLVQVIVAGILVGSGFWLYTGAATIDASQLALALLTCFFFVGMASAVNLVDGHDGLAAGVSVISAGAFAVMAVIVGSHTTLVVSLALGGACLGFLLFNFPPGRIFMGDTGSMFLGVVLAIVACSLTMARPSPATFAGVCFVLGVPILDVFLAIVRRMLLKSPVFSADSLHMHHVLTHMGFSSRQVLFVIYSMQTLFAVVGVTAMSGATLPLVLGSVFVAVTFASFLRLMVASRQTGGRVAPAMSPGSIPLKSNLRGNLPPQRTSAGR